jgi:3-hydroxyacyl-CoA dehydrogenase
MDALRASDIDAVWVSGFGFPAYRGGPMYFAERVGLTRIVEKLRRDGIEPTPYLAARAAACRALGASP